MAELTQALEISIALLLAVNSLRLMWLYMKKERRIIYLLASFPFAFSGVVFLFPETIPITIKLSIEVVIAAVLTVVTVINFRGKP